MAPAPAPAPATATADLKRKNPIMTGPIAHCPNTNKPCVEGCGLGMACAKREKPILEGEIVQLLFNNSTASGDCRERLARKIADLFSWRLMNSAPTDGSRVLVYVEKYGPFTAHWDCGWIVAGCEHLLNEIRVTHWMPLPSKPSS